MTRSRPMMTTSATRAALWAVAMATTSMATGAIPKCVAAEASPQSDTDAARELFLEAVELAEQGRWEQARARYARSLELVDDPITLYSLAVAEAELERFAAAERRLREYLHRTELLPEDDPAARYREAAEHALVRFSSLVAKVTVEVSPRDVDAEIRVDGELVTSWPHVVDPGRHWIEAASPGFQRTTRDVVLATGARRTVEMDLTSAGTTDPVSSQPSDVATADPFPTGPVVVASVGGTTSLIGVSLGLAAVARASSRTDDDPSMPAIRRQAVAGDILAIAGAATAAGGLIWWLVDDEEEQTEAIDLALAPTSASLRLRF